MELKIDNLEVFLKAKQDGVEYFLGEYKSAGNEESVVVFFTIPSELTEVSSIPVDEIGLLEAKKLLSTYIETNVCISGHYAPFQQYFISLNRFCWIYPIHKYPKNGLRLLLNADPVDKSVADYIKILEENLKE